MSSLKTRQQVWTHLHDLVGSGSELPVAELPTVRDLMRYGLYLRQVSDEDRRNYTNDEIIVDIMNALLSQWCKANPRFTEPVVNSQKRIKTKLKGIWELATKVSLGRAKIQERENFMKKLDRLMDILTCKCKISSCCGAECCNNCIGDVHISCTCRREFKIPVIELAFIKSQREKVGSIGHHQMGSVDYPESKRQKLKNDRAVEKEKQKEKKRKRDKEDEEIVTVNESAIEHDEVESEENECDDKEVCKTDECQSEMKRKKYNTKDITNIALASLRHHTGLRETAEIATAAWIDAGIISAHDTTLVIDHNKVMRAQKRVMKKCGVMFEKDVKENGISCVFFDGRRDDTKVMTKVGDSDKMYPGVIKEEHYTVCMEPGGKYLCHFVAGKADQERTHAEIIADKLVALLKERGADKTLQAIGGDSCNVNTGWEGGVMHFVEERLQRKLVWIICDLHTGELPLRHLVTAVDGKTLSNNKWSGVLGKMLDSATDLDINADFPVVCVGPPLPQLSTSVIKDLSTDQSYGYRIVNAIRTGVVEKDFGMLEIGPVSHSRWLTTALRFMRIWISKHGLKGKNLENLKMIVEFCVGVYMPNWFNIKIHSNWVEGPKHLIFQLQLLAEQCDTVKAIVMPTVKRSAWYGFSECVLQAMLCSDEEKERIEAVQTVMKIRGDGDDTVQIGDSCVRPRRTPAINTDALTLSELIDWDSDGIYEPPLTCCLTTAEVKMLASKPMTVPDWPSHTQSVERCVKMTTEAAAHVYSQERRDDYIRGQILSRQLMKKNRSKQDMASLSNFTV